MEIKNVIKELELINSRHVNLDLEKIVIEHNTVIAIDKNGYEYCQDLCESKKDSSH